MTEARTEADAIAELADAAADTPFQIDGATVIAIKVKEPGGGEHVQIIDEERLLPGPRRAQGWVSPADVQSFRDYVTLHLGAGTTIWIDRDSARIVGVVNDHAATGSPGPGWGDHRAVLQLERTPEWQHWTGADGRLVSQEQFAEHVQQGIGEIIDPEPATMLEIAQSIQGATDATWRTAKRLDSGEIGFEYTEQIAATAGRRGDIAIPAEFRLQVSPFYGEPVQQVVARLRYRVTGGHLTIGYQLIQPHVVELNSLTEIMGLLRQDFPRVYMGEPRRA